MADEPTPPVTDTATAELAEGEEAAADLHARIPAAIRDLAAVYVTAESPSVRNRVRGRIAALLEYVEMDRCAGLPPRPSGFAGALDRFLPKFVQGAVILADHGFFDEFGLKVTVGPHDPDDDPEKQ